MLKWLVLFSLLLHYLSGLQIYVQAEGQNHQCQNITPCATISHYVSNNSHYFESNNLQMSFFPGNHHLNSDINFSYVKNLVLNTASSSLVKVIEVQIMCREEVGFLFANVANLTLSGLTFTGCSRSHTVQNHQPYYNGSISAGVFLRNVTNLTLSGLTVQHSKGYGVFFDTIYGSSLIKNSIFQYNIAPNVTSKGGNAVLAYSECKESDYADVVIESVQFLSGHSHCTAAGLVLLLQQCHNMRIENTVLHNNSAGLHSSCIRAPFGGGNLAVIVDRWDRLPSGNSPSISIANSTITRGVACFGGGMFLKVNKRALSRGSFQFSVVKTLFKNNSALAGGGGTYVELYSQGEYLSRSEDTNNSISINDCSFENNSLLTSTHGGVALMFISQSFGTKSLSPSLLLQSCEFRGNHVVMGGTGNRQDTAVLYVSKVLEGLTIVDCNFDSNSATGITAFNSVLTFKGITLISNNSGHQGGGMFLWGASYILLGPNCTLTIAHNYANYTGGGLYVEEQGTHLQDPCFYQVLDGGGNMDGDTMEGAIVRLISNTALYGGDQIYGGRVKNCTDQNIGRNNFEEMFKLINEGSDNTSVISSMPERVRICKDGSITTNRGTKYSVYSGEYINISLALTGQSGGTTPGIIEFMVISESGNSPALVKRVSTSAPQKGCSDYTIAVYTNVSSVTLDIGAHHMHPYSIFESDTGHIRIDVEILPTPLGFVSTGNDSRPYKCLDKPNITELGFGCVLHKSAKEVYIGRKPPF